MIVLGVILIVLGLLLPALVPTFAYAHICFVIGIILLVVGLLLMVAGRRGHAVGGRRDYYLPATYYTARRPARTEPAAAAWGGRGSAECGRDLRRSTRRSGHRSHTPAVGPVERPVL